MKNWILYISFIVNIFLVGVVVYICGYKTDIFLRAKARVTGTVYVPARMDDDCVASWNSCIRKLNLDADIVFFGNSITEGGEFQDYFPEQNVVVMGYIGENTKGMLRRVEAIRSVHPEKVFLMAGINGLKNQSWDDFDKWYGLLLDSVQSAVPEATIYVQSILPVTLSCSFCPNEKIIEANRHILQMAEARGLTYIDLHSVYAEDHALPESMSYDGLHLVANAYTPWVNEIRKHIEE